MIKTIIFDWFGVCVESFTETLSQELHKKTGIRKNLLKKVYLKQERPLVLGKVQSVQVLKNIFRESNIDKNPKRFTYIFTSLTKPKKEVLELAKKLRKRYKTVLFSDNFDYMTMAIRKNLRLKEYFDLIVFSNEVSMTKREDKIYKFLIKKVKTKPEQCLLIDDKQENLARAGKFGIKGILFKNAKQVKRDLTKLSIPA